jgi:dienelactone hydrolase
VLPAQQSSAHAIEETALWLGERSPLFGVLSAPEDEPASLPRQSRKVILLVNSGAIHHVGPNRMYVTLARRWASEGHTVLRFDVSGIGDSPPRPGEPENIVYGPHAVDDVRQALEYLPHRSGNDEYQAIGLCSGAYHSFKAAVQGLPLSGVIVINPLTFFWKDGMSLEYPDYQVAADVQRYQGRVRSLQAWRKLLRGKVNLAKLLQALFRHARGVFSARVRDVLRALGIPLKDDLGRELESLAAKSSQMSFVFAAQDPGLALLQTQGGAAFRRLKKRRQLVVRLIAGADHTFTNRRARAQLADILAEELDRPAFQDGSGAR